MANQIYRESERMYGPRETKTDLFLLSGDVGYAMSEEGREQNLFLKRVMKVIEAEGV